MDFESIVSTIPPSRRVIHYNRKIGGVARGRKGKWKMKMEKYLFNNLSRE